MGISPDGRWRWDGTQWVPAQPQPSARRRSSALGWTLAGCGTVLVLAVAGVGYAGYAMFHGYFNGSKTCLPSDFPRYPGAAPVSWGFDLNGWDPGGGTCNFLFESSDDVSAVTAFYKSSLNGGRWRVTTVNESAGTVNFQVAAAVRPFGTVTVAAGDTKTGITIDIFGSTCLPLGFPAYPKAGFGGQSPQANGTNYGCHIVFVSNDAVPTVTRFYERNLNRGNWHVDSSSGGEIRFRLMNGRRTTASGTVNIALSEDRTEITIDSLP